MLFLILLTLPETMKLTRPLIFYGIALYIGCVSYIFNTDIKLLGAVLAASFLIIILVTVEKKFSLLIIGFFFTGILSSLIYYNTNSIGSIQHIRIVKNKGYYAEGLISGKNVIVKGNINRLEDQDIVITNGRFEPGRDSYKGIIGTIYINGNYSIKKDMISHIFELKRSLYDKFSKAVGEEKSALIMSLCFGESRYLSDEQKFDFQKLGVVHAISVSGFHMAIIYKLLENIAGFQISILLSLIYMIFTGSQAATIRAFIMILILKLSKKVFKNYDALSSLSLSAIIILVIKPSFAADLGFILSYLSTLGIILYYGKIRRYFYKLPGSINEGISLALSSQVFSMPYSALALKNICIGFLPGNLVLLPLYSLIVIFGNLAFVFVKIDIFFKLFCSITYIFTIIIDGVNFILLKISPNVVYMPIIASMALLGTVVSFIMVKKGFARYKYVPIFLLLLVVLHNYSFIPKIQFINYWNNEGIIISYKSEKVLICSYNEDFQKDYDLLKQRFNITKVIFSDFSKLAVKINNKVNICSLPNEENIKAFLAFVVDTDKKDSIITRNIEQFKDVDTQKYDIIELPKEKYFVSGTKNINYINVKSYKIAFDKVYPALKIED